MDLVRLAQDEDFIIQMKAAIALGSAIVHVPDKDQAWQDLVRLTQDEDSYVRWRAADALGAAFAHVPDKDQAWQDLSRLTQDEDSDCAMESCRCPRRSLSMFLTKIRPGRISSG